MAKLATKKNTTINASEAALNTAAHTDSEKEVFAPAGKSQGSVANTTWLNTSDAGAVGEKEVFLIRAWDDGTIYYIDPDHLDTIDRKRLTRALKRANSQKVQLWTILKDTKLSNQKNALEYFHQVTRTYKPEGANRAPTASELTNRVRRAEEGLIERGGLSDVGLDTPNSSL